MSILDYPFDSAVILQKKKKLKKELEKELEKENIINSIQDGGAFYWDLNKSE